MYKAVIFDFDGTLADTLNDVTLCMQETFEAFGDKCTDRVDVKRTMGLPLEAAFAELRSKDSDPADIAERVEHYRRLYARQGGVHTRLYPGVQKVLHGALKVGIQSLVVSNKGHDAIDAALKSLGIANTIARVFAVDTVRFRKPDRRLYQEEIKPVLENPSDAEVLVVGDSESDLIFARNSGLASCWAAYGYGDASACQQLNPDIVIHAFDELNDLLFPPGR